MWIIIVLCAVFVTCLVWAHFSDFYEVGGLLAVITAIVLVLFSVFIPIYRADAYDHIAQRDALQATYDAARSHSDYEMVSMAGKVADYNAWLASAQYWNHTQWKWYWPDAVNHVKPIR
jgi:hypothetical protein